MADTKISGLTAITTVDDADVICVVDTSHTSGGGGMGSGGSTRKATKANFLKVGTDIQAYDAQLTTLAGFTAAQVTRGISDGNLLTANDAVADNDWLRIDGTEVEGRSDAEIKADLSLEIGTDVQAYDADTAKTDTAQAWTLPQRTALLTDNDGSFDLSAKQNFFCTPGTARALTFANPQDGQSGFVKLVNAGAYVHTAHANTKIHADDLTAIGAAGTFLLGYLSDGTNTWVTVSKALA